MSLFILIIGRYLMYAVFIILLVGILVPGYRSLAVFALMSAILAAVVSWLIKDYFYLPRPFILSGTVPVLPYLLDGSWPSSHTSSAMAVAVSIFIKHQRLGLLFIFLAVLIAVGRIMGGVHSYLDIFSGALLGVISAWVLTPVTHNDRLLKQ
jgi:undecaprenyl-diphosphatase